MGALEELGWDDGFARDFAVHAEAEFFGFLKDDGVFEEIIPRLFARLKHVLGIVVNQADVIFKIAAFDFLAVHFGKRVDVADRVTLRVGNNIHEDEASKRQSHSHDENPTVLPNLSD